MSRPKPTGEIHRLCQVLHKARVDAELSQQAVADATGIWQSSISEFESGITTPSLTSLDRWAAAFNRSVTVVSFEATFEATEIAPILAYGFDLGGPGRWNFHGTLADVFPWLNGDVGDFRDQAVQQLDAHRRDLGVDLAGVDVLWYGDATDADIPLGYILSATTYSQHYSRALTLPLTCPAPGDWDRRLGHATDILGFTPRSPAAGPRWILAASRGVHP